jgi:hypothetical protein
MRMRPVTLPANATAAMRATRSKPVEVTETPGGASPSTDNNMLASPSPSSGRPLRARDPPSTRAELLERDRGVGERRHQDRPECHQHFEPASVHPCW